MKFARIGVIVAVGVALIIAAVPATARKNTTVRGEARTLEGFVVPGELEVLVVKGMPDQLEFQLPIGPGFLTPRCRDPYVCEPSFGKRPGGGLTFKADERGRARITFVMPSSFIRRNLRTSKKETLQFEEGEGVRIQANGFKGKVTGVAVAKAKVGG